MRSLVIVVIIMTESENVERKEKIEIYKWLIDQKLEYFKSFETRIVQILGFNGLLLTLIWTNLPSAPPIFMHEIIIIIIYILFLLFQLFFFILIGIPRTGGISLLMEENYNDMIKNMMEYFVEKSKQLRKRAQYTSYSYYLFGMQVILLILLVITRSLII